MTARDEEHALWKMLKPEADTLRLLAETDKRKVMIVVLTAEDDGTGTVSSVVSDDTKRKHANLFIEGLERELKRLNEIMYKG